MFNFFKKKQDKINKFDIFNESTWDNASSTQEIQWNGKKIFDKDGNPATEEGIVDMARAMFNFLERNGDMIPQDRKIEMVKKLLNRMENPDYYAEEDKKRQEKQDAEISDGLFNPRDPETYKYAKNTKPLVIDGVQIFRTYTTGNERKEVREDETEKGFVTLISMELKVQHSINSSLTKEQEKKYIDTHIQRLLDECIPKT